MARTVSFGAPEGARDPLHDEKEVMRTFHKHVKHCDTCYSSLSSWRSGVPLCLRGHNYVLDMRPYFYCKAGKPYSMLDRERRDEKNRVFVPTEYKFVSALFEALNAGYVTTPDRSPRSRAKPIVHQPVAEIVYSEPRRHERPTIIIPAAPYQSSRTTPRTAHDDERRYREPRSRGSLYHEDERRRHRSGEAVYVLPRSPRYHL